MMTIFVDMQDKDNGLQVGRYVKIGGYEHKWLNYGGGRIVSSMAGRIGQSLVIAFEADPGHSEQQIVCGGQYCIRIYKKVEGGWAHPRKKMYEFRCTVTDRRIKVSP